MLTPHMVVEKVRRCGFAFMEEFWPHSSTREVANAFGKLYSVPSVGDLQSLRPKRRDESTPNLYSGNFGMDSFPLHTDLAHWYLPPRFLILRCVHGAASVATLLLHRQALLRSLPPTTSSRALFVPRRPITGRLALLRFLQRVGGEYILRWDQLFLEPANVEATEVALLITQGLISSTAQIVLENPGDTLILDNWCVLHGRSKVPDGAVSRVIERVYLDSLTR